MTRPKSPHDAAIEFLAGTALSTVKLQLLDEDEQPYSNCECMLEVDGVRRPGPILSDGEGQVTLKVPANARAATLTVTRDGIREKLELKLGHLDPYDTISGLQQRLNNLGFACGEATGTMSHGTEQAINAFMARYHPDAPARSQEDVQRMVKDEYGY